MEQNMVKFLKNEEEQSYYNFLYATEKDLYQSFKNYEVNAEKLIQKNLILPAYELCIKLVIVSIC